MNYILLKDLPDAKAGTVIEKWRSGYYETNNHAYRKDFLDAHPSWFAPQLPYEIIQDGVKYMVVNPDEWKAKEEKIKYLTDELEIVASGKNQAVKERDAFKKLWEESSAKNGSLCTELLEAEPKVKYLEKELASLNRFLSNSQKCANDANKELSIMITKHQEAQVTVKALHEEIAKLNNIIFSYQTQLKHGGWCDDDMKAFLKYAYNNPIIFKSYEDLLNEFKRKTNNNATTNL